MYTKVQTSFVESLVQQPASDQAQPAAPRLRARNIRRGSLAASGLAALTLFSPHVAVAHRPMAPVAMARRRQRRVLQPGRPPLLIFVL